jgi:hypothetical protein
MAMKISSAEAQLELALLDSKAQDFDRLDVLTFYTNSGLPSEIIFRLEELWEATKVLGGKIIHIGKIIFLEIARFIEKNPNLTIGVALGAAAGALVNLVPFLGPLLAPFSIATGALAGGVVGSRLDRGQKPGNWAMEIAQDVIIVAL